MNPAQLGRRLGLQPWVFAKRWQETTDIRRAGALGVFCILLFIVVNWRNYLIDIVPLSVQPVSFCRTGMLDLEPYRWFNDSLDPSRRYPFIEYKGRLYPRKSIFNFVVAIPFYLPPILAGVETSQVEFWVSWGKMWAALLSGISVAVSYLTMRRWGEVLPSTCFSLLLALGTCMWTVVGQSFYDHTTAVLCVAGVALTLRDFPLGAGRAWWAAFMAGAAVAMRQSSLFLLIPLGIYLWFLPGLLANWKSRASALAGIVVLPLLNGVTNHFIYGTWHTTGTPQSELDLHWSTPWYEGSLGLLFAPNSGLLVQSPFLWLAVLGAWFAWVKPGQAESGLLRAYSLCFLADLLFFSRWYDWQGGLTFSSRMLCESYPLLMPLAMVGWQGVAKKRFALPLVAAAGLASILYNLMNIAIFDRVSALNPLHDPWRPSRHFLMIHLDTFGVADTTKALAWTMSLFVLVALASAAVANYLFLREKADPINASSVRTDTE